MPTLHIFTLSVLLFLISACDPASFLDSGTPKDNSPASRYHPALLLKTSLRASARSVLELVPPSGYHKAEETPDNLFTSGAVTATRDGMTVTFRNAEVGDRAWVEVYYCPKTKNAGLCTFRPIEVSFNRRGPKIARFSLPDPAG